MYMYCFLFSAHIPLFLYPFLHTVSKTRPFEYLRLTSLGVIGALVKVRNFIILYYQHGDKTCLWGFRSGLTQTRLHNHRRWLELSNVGFRKLMDCAIFVAKSLVKIFFGHNFLYFLTSTTISGMTVMH